VTALVLDVDPQNKRISLGLKQAHEDPWDTITNRYKVGQVVSGVVSKVASFGAFVELEEGVDGLVHISQLSEHHVEKVRDVLNVGDSVEARIVRVDRSERRIGLSIKAVSLPEEEFSRQQEELLEGLRPGEEMVGLASAFDQALGIDMVGEEWTPGQEDPSESAPEEVPTE